MGTPILLLIATTWAIVVSKSTRRSLDGQIMHIEHVADNTVKKDASHTLGQVMKINLRSDDGQLVDFNLVKNVKLTRSVPIEVDDGEDIYIDDLTSTIHKKKFHERNMFYHDHKRNAVVALTDDGDKITMRASFLHGGQLYQVEPLDKHPTAHRVTRDELPTQGFDYVRSNPRVATHISLKNGTEGLNRKRASPDQFKHPSAYSVELYLITDKSFYDSVENTLAPSNTKEAVLETIYFRLSFIMNGVDLAYYNIKKFDIDIWAKKIYISTDASTSPWTENNKVSLPDGKVVVDESPCLDQVGKWATETKGYKWYQYDHFMMFTAYDIGEKDDNGEWLLGTIGLAYTGTICSPGLSSSINEDTGFKLWMTAAHELGHNLGAPHDGETEEDNNNPDCRSDALHLMTPIDETPTTDKLDNVATFSPCTEEHIYNNIYGNNEENMPKACVYNAVCGNEASNIDWSVDLLPGQKWTLDQQCEMATKNFDTVYGKFASSKYDESDFPEICYDLQCTNDESDEPTSTSGAAVGTFCNAAQTKWCVLADCVSTSTLPQQGDLDYPVTDPDFQCQASPPSTQGCSDYDGEIDFGNGDVMTCAQIVEDKPEYCGDYGGIGGDCCHSCEKHYFIPV